jgi:hypothetical protein
LVTARHGHIDDALRAWLRAFREGQVVELTLAPLEMGPLQRLLQVCAGMTLAPARLTEFHARCGGNPLMALELIRAERGTGAMNATDLRRLLAQRLSRLSPGARDATRVAGARRPRA